MWFSDELQEDKEKRHGEGYGAPANRLDPQGSF